LDRADLVVGVRTPRRDPRHRRLLSRLLRGCIRAVFGQRLADGNSPFRVMRRTFLAAQLPAIPETFPAPNLLLSLAAARHNTLAEVPVRHRARTAGRSTLLRLSLIRFCLTTLTRLLLYRLRAWPRLTS
jgi:hypothetical protein